MFYLQVVAMISYRNKQYKFGMLLIIIVIMVASVWLHLTNKQSINQPVSEDTRVFSPDWGVGATLVSLKHPPIAMGGKRLYPVWVQEPKMPSSVIDSGIRAQPNLELLAQLQPDLILDTRYYKENRSFYDPNIPVKLVDFDIKDKNVTKVPEWSIFSNAVKMIGAKLNQPEKADQYLNDSHERIINAGINVRRYLGNNRKIMFINFWDAREIRVGTINNRVSLAIKMMGLEPYSIGEASHYGFSAVPIHKLYELPQDTCLIIVEPIPETTKYEIAHSPIWQRSPFFRSDACVYKIDPVWTRGGIEVLVTFAENLEKVVTTQSQNEFSYEYVTQIEGGL